MLPSDTRDKTLRWTALPEARVAPAPFPRLIVSEALSGSLVDTVERDSPETHAPGSFPYTASDYGPAFARLIERAAGGRIRGFAGEEVRHAFGRLKETLLTVRGHCRPADGGIHRDSEGKPLTVPLCMNGPWEHARGRPRLLNGPLDLDDYRVETPPGRGTLLAFARVENAWHGESLSRGRAGPSN